MARLSGLPSEHHHEGPGDAPRRKRGRRPKNQTPSEDMTSTGKRTASPTAELSQMKRTKLVQLDDDEDQIAEETQQSFSRSQQGDTIHVETQSSSSTFRRPTRRYSEPPIPAEEDEDELASRPLASTQPTSGLTPHLDRIGASRTRFTNKRRARMSMPAQLHIERVDEADEDGTQFQYAPLTAVLDSRTRRRLRRSHLSQEVNEFEDHQKKDKKMLLELRRQLRSQDEKIKDLEYQLEARRLGDIDLTDEHAEELEHQLAQAREQIDELRASSLYNGDDHDAADMSDDEDDDFLLVNPEELHISQDLDMEHTPNGEYASRVLELSNQVTFESLPGISQLSHDTLIEDEDIPVPDKIHDQAVERYERELQHYIRLLAESQGALRVMTLELQNLHVIDAGASTDEILLELRHGFDTLRAEVEKYFPNTTTGLTNQQLLRKVPELFSGIFFELREKLTLISASQKTEVLLRRQYEGVLDLLGESDERVQQLEKDVYNLDKSNERKQRTILDLEERVTALDTLAKNQEDELKENDAQIHGLQDENEDKETSIERLQNAIETYREDLDKVTQTATAFEQEHHAMIARLEEEHAETVQALSAELGAETEGREAAEADALQKGAYIEELEGSIARMETDVDAITNEMNTLRERLAAQSGARAAAEGERDEQAELVYQHANTIENLNETIVELKEDLAEAQANLGTERSQREKTEAALDEANEKIEDLNVRLHDAGIQANELRSKLFQVQQEKEETIAQLQQDAQEREDELNDQLTNEEQLRETAEATIAKLDEQIRRLQGSLVTVEENVVIMTEARDELAQDRDTQVAALTTQLADLKAKYTALENSTNSTITSLQANITDLNNQVQRQQAEVKRLVEEAAEKDRVYLDDTTALKEKIEILEEDLGIQKAENESYRHENASLSKRVEDEANELLNIVGSHTEQITSLQTVISTQKATIQNLQDASAQRTTEFEETVEERTREITELQLMGDARAETITILEAQITTLKERFEAAEEDTRVTINALMLSQRQLQDQNEQLANALKARNAEALKAVQEMKLKRVEVKTQGVDLHRVAVGKVTKTSEKVKIGKKGKKKVAKRQWDSGFGVDENVEDGEDVNGEEPIAA
ncbi:Nn.00g032690.m01.CDS01 [Neocucurbitaria sp. VM-36]